MSSRARSSRSSIATSNANRSRLSPFQIFPTLPSCSEISHFGWRNSKNICFSDCAENSFFFFLVCFWKQLKYFSGMLTKRWILLRFSFDTCFVCQMQRYFVFVFFFEIFALFYVWIVRDFGTRMEKLCLDSVRHTFYFPLESEIV